jgi:hypothetical protein
LYWQHDLIKLALTLKALKKFLESQMQRKILPAVFSILLCVSQWVFAAPATTTPAKTITAKTVKPGVTCPPLKLKSVNKNIVLNETTPAREIYFLKNQTQKSIWIDHPVKHPSASAGWSSYMRPGEWSALLLDKKDFSISCSVIQPGKVDNLDCAQALSVCKPPHLVYPAGRKGSFWIAEGKSWKELLKALDKRGIK